MVDGTEAGPPAGSKAPVSQPAPGRPEQTRISFIGTAEEQRAISAVSTIQGREYAVILREMTLADVVKEYHKLKKLLT